MIRPQFVLSPGGSEAAWRWISSHAAKAGKFRSIFAISTSGNRTNMFVIKNRYLIVHCFAHHCNALSER